MLKHVQISPHRNRSDSVSLRSTTSCASSICSSPEPSIESLRPTSRALSYYSLDESIPQTIIKVYTSCLKLDIEYKTLGVNWNTTSKDVVSQILRRCKMRQKDSRLFYLSMEVTVRKAGVKTVLALDDDARPAILQVCHPKGDSRFCLQIRPGGLIRVHTTALQPTALYKSLIISEETTSDELLKLLLKFYNLDEPVEKYSLYEVCSSQEYQRKLHPDDLPLRAKQQRIQSEDKFHFIVRKNPNFSLRRQLLPIITENKPITLPDIENVKSHTAVNLNYARLVRIPTADNLTGLYKHEDKNQYVPVYNSREIYTVCNSFSSFDIDKKLYDMEYFKKTSQKPASLNIQKSIHNVTNSPVREAVKNNPAKGFGSFVYV